MVQPYYLFHQNAWDHYLRVFVSPPLEIDLVLIEKKLGPLVSRLGV
jgi:hypothetical protein